MLTAPDSDIARRDTALPGLATLLDPEAFARVLGRELPAVATGEVTATYVKYKPGTSCLAGFYLTVNGNAVAIYGKAFPRDAQFRLRRARQKPGVRGPLGLGRLALADDSIVVSVFPNDYKVASLDSLTGMDSQQRLLDELFPMQQDLRRGAIERLVYKPERRYVGYVMVKGKRRAALKLYTQHGYSKPRKNAGAFVSRGALRIPDLLSASDEHSALAFAWAAGGPLSDALSDGNLDMAAVAHVGAALADFHRQNPDGLSSSRPTDIAQALFAEADWLEKIYPAAAPRAAHLVRRLASELNETGESHCPVHGDFHARQVLLGDGCATILDLDQAARGEPASDLGNFLAHLEREVVRGNLLPNQAERIREALLEGYRSASKGWLPARIELYMAIGFFRLSLRFFRYREPDWPLRMETLLDQAENTLRRRELCRAV